MALFRVAQAGGEFHGQGGAGGSSQLGGEVGKVALRCEKVGDLHLEHNNEGLEDDFCFFHWMIFGVPSCSIRYIVFLDFDLSWICCL